MQRRKSAISLLLILASPVGLAAEPEAQHRVAAVSSGYERFIDSCAFCHGVDARGNGDAANLLSKQPANLTRLSKNNGDEFPLEYVYDTIDGRKMTDSHGLREMPVWGNLWTKSVPSEHSESYVRARIFEIIMFLYSVQE